MTGHPDGNLAEPAPYPLPELKKELAVLVRILDVHKDPHQLVAVRAATGLLSVEFLRRQRRT